MANSTSKSILEKQFSIRGLLILLFLCALASTAIVLQLRVQAERAKNQLLKSSLDWRLPSAVYLRIDEYDSGGKRHLGSSVGITGSVYMVDVGTPLKFKAELIEMATGAVISEVKFDAVPSSEIFGGDKLEHSFATTIPSTLGMKPGKYLIRASLISEGEQVKASGTKIVEFSE
jgi:hypothetical protein